MSRHSTILIKSVLAGVGLCVAAGSAGVLLQHPQLRAQVDATKTRAYTLSDSTTALLKRLEGDWSVSMIMVEQDADPAVVRQIDEVLERYAEAAPRLSVSRIDPTNPASIGDYERLLSRMQSSYAEQIRAYDDAIGRGLKAYDSLRSFADRQVGVIGELLTALGRDDAQRNQLQQLRSELLQFTEQSNQFLSIVAKLRATSAAQPIPDYDAARSALAANHAHWASQLDGVSRLMARWLSAVATSAAVRAYAESATSEFESVAQSLKNSQDELTRLEPLELTEIGRQLAEGECAILLGPNRAGVIPSWQIFPRGGGQGVVTFDRRFRGEEVISATIRSLQVRTMPMVVFVHGEEGTLLRRREGGMDLFAMGDALRAARYDVREWATTKGDRPAVSTGQKAVWIVVPPLQRTGLELSAGEKKHLEAVKGLIADGEPVLLSVARSLLPLFRQPDPWSTIAAEAGVVIDTGKVIFESIRVAQGASESSTYQVVRDMVDGSRIAGAVDGQALLLNHPTPLGVSPGDSVRVLAEIEPSATRWLENDWRDEGGTIQGAPTDKIFAAPQPVIAEAERPHPLGTGRQRLVVVGSAGWMMSVLADQAESLGGNRVALAFPGNREFMLSSVAWLAGLDDLIVPGGMAAQETARLDGVTEGVRTFWSIVVMGLLPAACVLAGGLVWMVRRRS